MIALQKLTVMDAYRQVDEDPILAKMTDEFSLIINNFAQHAELRGVFVLDDKDSFSGVITRTDLLNWASVRLGAFLLRSMTDLNKTIRLMSLFNATTAGDALRPETQKAAVMANDTLAHALGTMIEWDLIVLPVIDDSQKIIGSLSLSELLKLALDESLNDSQF
jgi:CBS-domain-containing membrane protein